MFSEVIEHLENNYENNMVPIDFHISSMKVSTFDLLDVNYLHVKKLPPPNKISNDTLYFFIHNNKYHCIFSYCKGIIFNPDPNLNLKGYKNITKDKVELTNYEYFSFMKFMKESYNNSYIMHIIKHTEICTLWCLLIAYLHSKGFSYEDFIEYIQENGEYKDNSFNKMHYLFLFAYHCYIINEKLIN